MPEIHNKKQIGTREGEEDSVGTRDKLGLGGSVELGDMGNWWPGPGSGWKADQRTKILELRS